MKTLPEDCIKDLGDLMSNFDHEIEPDAETELKSGESFGYYAAWFFHGIVWWDGVFNCQVKQFGTHVATIEADTLKEIMTECCKRYGSE